MKTFEINTPWNTTNGCFLVKETYLNNLHVALSIFCDEGPFADLTVNIDGIERFPKNFSCIDTNDFPQGTMLAEQLGIGKPTEYVLRSGFCTYPVYEFDMDKIKEYIEEV